MSVQQTRFAATRTAARTRGFRGRVKLALTWLTVLVALSLFTLTVVGTAAAKKPDVAGAANKLPKDQPIIVINGKKQVCSVNASQLKVIQAEYDTGWMKVKIDGVDTDVVTVTGMKENELKKMLGNGKQVKCEVVEQQHVFYLPFDAQTS